LSFARCRGLRRAIERIAPVVALLAVLGFSRGVTAQAPGFVGKGELRSENGAIHLEWSGLEPPYRVQLGDEVGDEIVYEGRIASAFVSGLPDGRYELRLQQRDGTQWRQADVRTLVVQHHALSTVIPLLWLGALTFVGTAVLVFTGARRTTRKSTRSTSAPEEARS